MLDGLLDVSANRFGFHTMATKQYLDLNWTTILHCNFTYNPNTRIELINQFKFNLDLNRSLNSMDPIQFLEPNRPLYVSMYCLF